MACNFVAAHVIQARFLVNSSRPLSPRNIVTCYVVPQSGRRAFFTFLSDARGDDGPGRGEGKVDGRARSRYVKTRRFPGKANTRENTGKCVRW